jgi:hypothetical protein
MRLATELHKVLHDARVQPVLPICWAPLGVSYSTHYISIYASPKVHICEDFRRHRDRIDLNFKTKTKE